jgi:hypothetical protein
MTFVAGLLGWRAAQAKVESLRVQKMERELVVEYVGQGQ